MNEVFNPLTPVPPVIAHDDPLLTSITFDQNWHHLHSAFAGGKDLYNDAQIRVIGEMEPELCLKMLRNSSEKVKAKFPVSTRTTPWQNCPSV